MPRHIYNVRDLRQAVNRNTNAETDYNRALLAFQTAEGVLNRARRELDQSIIALNEALRNSAPEH